MYISRDFSVPKNNIQKFNSEKSYRTVNVNPIVNGSSKLAPLQEDFFHCVTKPGNIKKSETEIQYIQKLYDEVIETVRSQNPMFDELKIPTPKINIIKDSENGESGNAYYTIYTNSIFIKESQITDDFYMCLVTKKDGTKIPFGVCAQSDKENVEKLIKDAYKDVNRIDTIKLTENEKRLYLKSVLAHELRHCLQEHMSVSIGDSNAYLAQKQSDVKKLLDATKELADIYKDSDNPEDEKKYENYMEELKSKEKKYSYILNFKPAKVLDENAELNFSVNSKEDNRKWSVKNHFLKSALDHNKDYYSSPFEMDAYHYEEEYILSQYQENKDKYRFEPVLAMVMWVSNNYSNIDKLKKYGYEELN